MLLIGYYTGTRPGATHAALLAPDAEPADGLIWRRRRYTGARIGELETKKRQPKRAYIAG